MYSRQLALTLTLVALGSASALEKKVESTKRLRYLRRHLSSNEVHRKLLNRAVIEDRTNLGDWLQRKDVDTENTIVYRRLSEDGDSDSSSGDRRLSEDCDSDSTSGDRRLSEDGDSDSSSGDRLLSEDGVSDSSSGDRRLS